jgi:hypothetical protein
MWKFQFKDTTEIFLLHLLKKIIFPFNFHETDFLNCMFSGKKVTHVHQIKVEKQEKYHS